MPPGPIHIHPTAPLAERALLPGDPGRALTLARLLFDSAPRMFNHHRGLWGYTGTAVDGAPLTVQSTGMGGPSAAIVVEELCVLGLRRAVRVGTCDALDGALALGDLVTAREVIAADGASRALGAPERLAPDPALLAILAPRADHAGLVVSTDLFYDPRTALAAQWARAGALAVEMQAAAILTVAQRRGIAAACLLAVGGRDGARLGDQEHEHAAERLGHAGLAALAPTAAAPRPAAAP